MASWQCTLSLTGPLSMQGSTCMYVCLDGYQQTLSAGTKEETEIGRQLPLIGTLQA